jgi:hypothetical protein
MGKKESKLKKVKIATLAQALNAGFTPKGEAGLANSAGATVGQDFLEENGGRVSVGTPTGNSDYPYIVEGKILHKALAFPEVKSVETESGTFYRFSDGSIMTEEGITPGEDFEELLSDATSEEE